MTNQQYGNLRSRAYDRPYKATCNWQDFLNAERRANRKPEVLYIRLCATFDDGIVSILYQ